MQQGQLLLQQMKQQQQQQQHSSSLYATLSSRWKFPYNLSGVLIWMLGVLVASGAAYLSASDYHKAIQTQLWRRCRRNGSTTSTSTSTMERQSLEQSSPERALAQRSALQDDTLELEPIHAVGFILMASSSLLILFYFKVRTNGNVETKRNESNRRSAVPDRTDISFSPRCISLLDLCHRQSLLCLWM